MNRHMKSQHKIEYQKWAIQLNQLNQNNQKKFLTSL